MNSNLPFRINLIKFEFELILFPIQSLHRLRLLKVERVSYLHILSQMLVRSMLAIQFLTLRLQYNLFLLRYFGSIVSINVRYLRMLNLNPALALYYWKLKCDTCYGNVRSRSKFRGPAEFRPWQLTTNLPKHNIIQHLFCVYISV